MPLPKVGFSYSSSTEQPPKALKEGFINHHPKGKLNYRFVPEFYPRNQKIDLSKINRIVFENAYGLGDVFVSRSLVDRITREFPNKDFFYIHDYSKHMLKDLNLEEISHDDFHKKFNTRSQFYVPKDIKS